MEWTYVTPSIYTRTTLREAQQMRDMLMNNCDTCKRISIYHFTPMATQPGFFNELGDETRYPEKHNTND
jgi:hypothetical protein